MLTNQFIQKIDKDIAGLAEKWARGVVESEYTKTYRKFPEEKLLRIGSLDYRNLVKWFDPGASALEIGSSYAKIAAQRYEDGFPLCELSYAIHFVKKILLNHVFSEGIMPDTLKLYQTHDFVARVHDFFDLASFYLTRGFQETVYKKIVSLPGVDKGNVDKIFPAGSFYYEREPAFRTFEKAMEGFNLFKVK